MESISGDDPNEVLDSDNESEESGQSVQPQRPTPTAPSKQPATKHLSSKAVPNLPKPQVKTEPDVPDPATSGMLKNISLGQFRVGVNFGLGVGLNNIRKTWMIQLQVHQKLSQIQWHPKTMERMKNSRKNYHTFPLG